MASIQTAIRFHDDTWIDRCGFKRNYRSIRKNRQTKEELEASIRKFFLKLDSPIRYEDIDKLRDFAERLAPDYEIDERESEQQYDLSIDHVVPNDTNYNLELSCYGGERMCVDLKFNKIKYTQYQVKNYIFQVYSIEYTKFDLEVHKRYDVIKGQYVSGQIDFQINSGATRKKNDGTDMFPKYVIPKNDLLLCVTNFAKHCHIETKLPSSLVELPVTFSFTASIGSFNIPTIKSDNKKKRVAIHDVDGETKYVNVGGSLCDVGVYPIDSDLANFSIQIRSDFEIDIICAKSSLAFKDVYRKGWGIDNETLGRLLSDENLRLDEFFGLENVIHSVHIYHKSDDVDYVDGRMVLVERQSTRDRKQIYHDGILVFDRSIYIDDSRYDYQRDNNWRADIYVNKLGEYDLKHIKYPIPDFVSSENPTFEKQFIRDSYYEYRRTDYCRRIEDDNGEIKEEIYNIDRRLNRMSHEVRIDGYKECIVINDMNNGEVITKYESDRNLESNVSYRYKGFDIKICTKGDKIEKWIYLEGNLLFHGFVEGGSENSVMIDRLDNEHKLKLNYFRIIDVMNGLTDFITIRDVDVKYFGYYLTEGIIQKEKEMRRQSVSKETFKTNDPDIVFKFKYNPPINVCGLFDKIKLAIAKKKNKGDIKLLTKREYDNNGHEKMNQ